MRQGLMETGLVMGLTRDDREGLAFALAAWQVTDVALGDVHGDGSEELAVIEEKADGPAPCAFFLNVYFVFATIYNDMQKSNNDCVWFW